MPAEKKLPQDTINRFVPEKNPGQIDQGAFNVPFNSDSPDDDGNGIYFGRFGVGSIRLRTSRIETNHRVFHAIGCFHRNGSGVGEGNGVFGIGINGVLNGLGGILAVNGSDSRGRSDR